MPATLKGPAAVRADINVTPLIDVLLVLLIIFIVIKLLQERPVQDIQVPRPAATAPLGPTFQIVLELTPAGSYAVNQQPVPAATLRDYLRQTFANRATKLLFIKTAPTRTYQEVIDAISIARAAGVQVIGIVPDSRR
jgi:biopolymer transport protein ExbD